MDEFLGHEVEVLPETGPNEEILGRCRRCGLEAAWDDGIGIGGDPATDPGWNEAHPSYVVPRDGRRPGMWAVEGGSYVDWKCAPS